MNLKIRNDSIDGLGAEEACEQYAHVKTMGDEVEKRRKELREVLIDSMKHKETLTVNGCSVSMSIRERKSVNTELANAMSKKKGVQLGTILYEIIPKSSVPQDVLDLLDQYFSLKEKLEIKPADVEKAVEHGLITDKEGKKLIEIQETPTITVKVDDDVKGQLIQFEN